MMARKPTGGILTRQGKNGTTYQLRFLADGRRQYLTLGSAADGWDRVKAEAELQNVLADVRRGVWKPPAPARAPVIDQDPTFLDFASDWFAERKNEWRETTQADYEWQLSHHLLPFFQHHRLSQITIAEVDRYRQGKVDEGDLSATSINKTLTRLGQILELAVERELLNRNVAKVGGKRRRVKPVRPTRTYLDRAEQITALLDAARRIDADANKNGQLAREQLLATIVFRRPADLRADRARLAGR